MGQLDQGSDGGRGAGSPLDPLVRVVSSSAPAWPGGPPSEPSLPPPQMEEACRAFSGKEKKQLAHHLGSGCVFVCVCYCWIAGCPPCCLTKAEEAPPERRLGGPFADPPQKGLSPQSRGYGRILIPPLQALSLCPPPRCPGAQVPLGKNSQAVD